MYLFVGQIEREMADEVHPDPCLFFRGTTDDATGKKRRPPDRQEEIAATIRSQDRSAARDFFVCFWVVMVDAYLADSSLVAGGDKSRPPRSRRSDLLV